VGGARARGAGAPPRHAARLDLGAVEPAPFVPWLGIMRQRNILLVLGTSTAILAAFAPACGSSGSTTLQSVFDAGSRDAVADRGAPGTSSDGATAGGDDGGLDAQADGAASVALVRFADWSPDAPAAGFDVCVQAQGGNGATWTGPLLGTGVPFTKVGAYSNVAPGTYTARVVAPGDSSCASAAATAIQLPALSAGDRITVALMGALSASGNTQAAEIVPFPDDVSPPQGQAAVRFIDALTGAMAVVFGTGKQTNVSFAALTGNVDFGTAATTLADGGAPAANGFLLLQPNTGATLSAHVAGNESDISTSTSTSFDGGGFNFNPGTNSTFTPGMDIASASNATWPAGSVVTVALLNGASGGAPQLEQCQDNAAPQGSFSDCNVLSP
jgi:hypothetical protein